MTLLTADYVQGKDVPLASLRLNAWNYNTEPPATFAKVIESLRRFGFSEPIVVRTIADGVYEVINGEHRVLAARELGMPEVPVFDLGVISDDRARELCVIFNELGGRPDTVRLADLLRDIVTTVAPADLVGVLPYAANELKHMLDSIDFSFRGLAGKDTRAADPEPPKVVEGVDAPASPVEETKRILLRLPEPASVALGKVAGTPEAAVLLLLDGWERRRTPEAAEAPSTPKGRSRKRAVKEATS